MDSEDHCTQVRKEGKQWYIHPGINNHAAQSTQVRNRGQWPHKNWVLNFNFYKYILQHLYRFFFIFTLFTEVNGTDDEGATPLHYAARYKRMRLNQPTDGDGQVSSGYILTKIISCN